MKYIENRSLKNISTSFYDFGKDCKIILIWFYDVIPYGWFKILFKK